MFLLVKMTPSSDLAFDWLLFILGIDCQTSGGLLGSEFIRCCLIVSLHKRGKKMDFSEAKVGFIGAGNMAQALGKGMIASGINLFFVFC